MQTSCFPIFTESMDEYPLYITSVGYGEEYPISRDTGLKDAQLLYTAEGEGEGVIDHKAVALKKGSILFMPPFTPHSYRPKSGGWQTFWITYSGFSAERLITSEAVVWESNGEEFKMSVTEICALFKTSQWSKESSVQLYRLLLSCREEMPFSAIRQRRLEKRLNPALAWIDTHYDRVLELSELSAMCGVSREYFCKIFRELTGMRPMEYINYVRIQNAKKMLLHSDLTIREIGERCGFSDSSYFCRSFRKLEVVTPAQFAGRK